MSKNALYLDNTMLSALHHCPAKFYWRHVLHLVKKREGANSALSFGKAIHKGLELYYLKGGDVEEGIAAFIQDWQKEGSPDDDKRSEAVGISLLLKYHEQYQGDKNWEILEVESRICVEVASDLIFCGRVDLVIKWLNQIYVVDHKTSSSTGSFIAKPNHQFTGYVSALQMLGTPAMGAIINLIGVYKTKSDFSRPITTRSERDKEKWLISLLETKTRIDQYAESGVWPMQTTGCFLCPYKELCNAESDTIQNATKAAFYEEEPWEPWKEHE